ncbi:MAG: ribosome silencing factor [Pseudomonadota bacterium]
MKSPLTAAALKDLIVESLDDDKAIDIQTIQLDEQAGLADHIIVASGSSSTQVVRLAEKLKERLNARGIKDVKLEGVSQGNWVIVDAGDIIVHLFRPEVREFYDIEKMWSVSSMVLNVPTPTERHLA